MNLLVALAMPPHGGALEYYSMVDGEAVLGRIEHQVGKAIIVESVRPHKVGTFDVSDSDGLQPRTVMASVLVPCWTSLAMGRPSGELAYLMLGPLGGPHGTSVGDQPRRDVCS